MRIVLNTVYAACRHIFTSKVTTKFNKKCFFTPMDFEKQICYGAVPYINRIIRAKDYGLIKGFAKHLNLTESYISKLITGERYNQEFEIFLRKILQFDYCFI